ncbi:MAG: DUF389 domain-containing protein [Rhodopseudomonas palustris]|nr:MAG: DUF389 domain-containing protein [Rhodopseudomonas palustris]
MVMETPKPGSPTVQGVAALFQIEGESYLDRAQTRQAVAAGARLSVSYFLMNAAATLIAGYGLLANSEAVVIGAMLIAMLYGPILGIGLALAELDVRLLVGALLTEVLGVVWVVAIGIGVGWLHNNVPISEQLLARTTPNLLDMMIALVGGAAGAYATVAKRISGAVVGVAIATALCPPLTACGILIAHGYLNLAGGAFLLFLTNLTAIAAAAMAVFLIRGHRARPSGASFGATWSARLVPLVVLLILSVYLVDALRKNIDDSSLRSSVKRVLEEGLRAQPGARVIEVRLTTESGRRNAFAVVRSPEALTADMVAHLNDKLDSMTGRQILLHVRTVPVQEITRDGPVFVRSPSIR